MAYGKNVSETAKYHRTALRIQTENSCPAGFFFIREVLSNPPPVW